MKACIGFALKLAEPLNGFLREIPLTPQQGVDLVFGSCFFNGRKQANVIVDWSPAVPCLECNWTHVDLLSIRIRITTQSKAQSRRGLSTVGQSEGRQC